VQSPQERPNQQQAARRKLVRGVFAAPALMTVCSGSALASQSSIRCLARHVSDNTDVMPKVGSLDNWTRVQLHKASDGKFYVSGSHVASVFTTSNSVYPAVGTWLQINGTAGTPVGSPSTTMPAGSTLGYTTPPPKYVVVRFDTAGNVTGVGTAGTGSNVGASCWNSFKAFV
jgi:hypothetical protein